MQPARAPSIDVDIGDGCQGIGGEQEDSTDGHRVRCAVEDANPISRSGMRYFERTFDFGCPDMPTSFHFRLTFARPDDDGNITNVISIRRTDRGVGSVDVSLVATVRREGAVEARVKHSFRGLEAGQVGRDAVGVTLREDAQTLEEAEDMRVDVLLTVERCHLEPERGEFVDTRDSEESSPGKLICCQSS